jgi:hypothetical protein
MMRYRVLAIAASALAGVTLGLTIVAARMAEGFGFGLGLACFLCAVACMDYGWAKWHA